MKNENENGKGKGSVGKLTRPYQPRDMSVCRYFSVWNFLDGAVDGVVEGGCFVGAGAGGHGFGEGGGGRKKRGEGGSEENWKGGFEGEE